MREWISGLFSSDKVVDNASKGLDKLVLTDEERLDNFHILLQLYTPFKIAQRLLALIFCIPYALAWLTTFMVSFWRDTANQEALLHGDIAYIVGIQIAFYFGGGAVEGVIKRFRGDTK